MGYCLDCGLQLNGRLDKKFCNDYCRSHHNNMLNRNGNAALKEINSILRRNSAILKKISEKGTIKLNKNTLHATGFDFNFFTHQAHGAKGEIYNCCYDYGYLQLNEEEYTIICFNNE